MADLTAAKGSVASAARVSLGLTGASVPVREHLRFQLDHALARDAVQAELDVALLQRGVAERGLHSILVRSAARDRGEYLRRPDLGRKLQPGDAAALAELGPCSVAVVVADGLSALAVERHALPLLDALMPMADEPGPVVLATQARVALADAIGEALRAEIAVMLIGERPGLSSPDSLGAYITWAPRAGRTDAERNCISNIRAEGLSYADAAARIAFYLREARRLHTTGVALKDPTAEQLRAPGAPLGE